MRLHIHRAGSGRNPALCAHVERRLHFALGRLKTQIDQVTVKLGDINGPRGGVDKFCRIVVRCPGSAPVVVEQRDADWLRATDLAVGRTAHAVRRALQRRVRPRQGLPAGRPFRSDPGGDVFLPRGGDSHALPGLWG
jgi:hypothetical protein